MFQNSLAYLSRTKQKCDQTSGIHFLCGLIAASCGTITSYPFDVVRTRLVAQKSNQVIYAQNTIYFLFLYEVKFKY